MKPELVSLQRRPFLAPIWLTAGFAFLGFCFCVGALWIWATANSTIVIVVRHAEKDLSVSVTDPPLTAAGQARAELLANMLGGGTRPGTAEGRLGAVDAIYVSPTVRSKETGKPLAERFGIRETVVPADDPKALARRALREHRGGRVVIVGHSDTVPALVKELSGNSHIPEIGDQEYGTLYIVTVPRIGRANLLRLSY